MTSTLLVQRDGGLVTLTLNRPEKLNALNLELFEALDAQARALAEDESAHVVILRGAGRGFSAGHDLGGIAEGEPHPVPNFQAKVVERLATLPQPLIAAVHGPCYT